MPLRALKDLVIRVMAGKMTVVRLAEFIGVPQGTTNPPSFYFGLGPGTHTSYLRATLDAAAVNLTIKPPSRLQGEFTLKMTAIVVGDDRFKTFTYFDFRVIVGEEVGPRKIEGGPSLLVSTEQGGEVMIRLTDYIEDPGGGRLTFAHGTRPRGLGVTRNGAEWTINVGLDVALGEHIIQVTATDSTNRSADFQFRVIVEESERLFTVVLPPEVKACLELLNTDVTYLCRGDLLPPLCITPDITPVGCRCYGPLDDYIDAVRNEYLPVMMSSCEFRASYYNREMFCVGLPECGSLPVCQRSIQEVERYCQ